MSYQKETLEISKFYVEGLRQGLQTPINKEIAQNVSNFIIYAMKEPYEFVGFVNGPSKTRMRNKESR